MTMTKDTGSAAPASGLTLWVKVLIWVAVIVIGFLYLRSVAHRGLEPGVQATASSPTGADESTQPAMPPVQATAPVPVAESKPAPADQASKSTTPSSDQPPVGKTPETSRAEPSKAVPSAEAPVASVTQSAPPAAATAATGAGDKKPQPPVSASENEKETATSVVSRQEPAVAQPVSHPGEAPTETPAPDVAKPEAAETRFPPGHQAMEDRRARILAEYEAMRKAAEEEWRRMRERYAAPPPPPVYYPPLPYGAASPSAPRGPEGER